jgi:aldose 1-epimerase
VNPEVVEIRAGSTTARIAPGQGFNCYSLVVDGFDYLHQEAGFLPDGSPTHSGTPILFPWPNRIAGSTFEWQGKTYQVPVTEQSTGASLHGFACRTPWPVIEQSNDSVTGEWILSRDAPAMVANWPADAGLRVTYRVEPTALIVTSEVFCPGDEPLPFGVGFHPYFRVPGPFDQWLLHTDATQAWTLETMIPTGEVVDIPPRLDFGKPRRIGDEHLDDVLTGLPAADGMCRRAVLMSMASSLAVSSDPQWREYVFFTPTSRDALAIEPYTCTTDAINLQQRGKDAGLRVLAPGAQENFVWRIDIA